MHLSEEYIAVDWGTTNRRAWLIGADGKARGHISDDQGVIAVGARFDQAIGDIRKRLGDHPLLMAGMIGSNRGWLEAPYVPCPAGIAELAERLVRPEERAAIVPGVCFVSDDRADVMRGEEVQVLGAVAAGLLPADCLVCHPGTHSKWVHIEGGNIASFRTVMTGELFSLLKDHSILSDLLGRAVEPGAAFRRGARQGLKSPGIAADLFSVRASVLLGRLAPEEAAPFISGLLIGADVRTGLATAGDAELFVMGRPELTSLYSMAIAEAGRTARQIDGEDAFLAGIGKIAEAMR